MKIIAIEGLENAGKEAATSILYNYFKNSNVKVARMTNPNYNTPTGKLIRAWLDGTYNVSPKVFELIQAADKQQLQDDFDRFEADGVEIVFVDRYVHTMWAYGAHDNDRAWLRELTMYMRKPDATVYLDVEPEVSLHRGGKLSIYDKYEPDIVRSRVIHEEYNNILSMEDYAEIYRIDANKPALVVNKYLFTIAKVLYHRYIESGHESHEFTKSIS